MSARRATLRIARRDAWVAKGRSALVIAMIALPVLTITAAATLLRTVDVSTTEALPQHLGRADARIIPRGNDPVTQEPVPNFLGTPAPEAVYAVNGSWTGERVAAALGPRARVIPVTNGTTTYRTEHGYASVRVRELDLRDPLTRGMMPVVSGHVPRNARQALVTRELVEQRGLSVGDTLRLDRGRRPVRVVGVADVAGNPSRPTGGLVVTLPGTVLDPGGRSFSRTWLAATPGPVPWNLVRDLNRQGLMVLSRHVVHDPPPPSAVPQEKRPASTGDETVLGVPRDTLGVAALTVTMVLLEIVLLAGPAFAIGLRRQRHQLALLAATGAQQRHLRSVVLSGGLLLGAGAAAVGALAGLGVAAGLAPALSRLLDVRMGPFDLPWMQVGLVAVLGAASGVLAAYAPARQAGRMDVVAALAGRRGQVRTRAGWPLASGVLVLLGLGGTALALWQLRLLGIAAGAALVIIGLVLASPWLVGQAGKVSTRLPLPLRLAGRDAARNRGRTAPAVAAIMAAVAGLTALSIGASSNDAEWRASYLPKLAAGDVLLRGQHLPGEEALSPGVWDSVRAAARRELPRAELMRMRDLGGCRARDRQCWNVRLASPRQQYGLRNWADTYTLVGGEKLARFAGGAHGDAAARAVAGGRVAVFVPGAVRGGTVELAVESRPAPGTAGGPGGAGHDRPEQRTVRLPAVAVETEQTGLHAVVPPELAKRLDIPTTTAGYAVDPAGGTLTERQERRLTASVEAITGSVRVYVERGFESWVRVPLLILAVAAAVLVLGATLIGTGLAAADARPDLSALAAVGAAPRTRRLLAMGQAAVVSALGVSLGIAAGVVPGVAAAWQLTGTTRVPREGLVWSASGPTVAVPWLLLGGVAIVVPLVAVLAAGLFTRSRLPLVRRAGQ